MDDRTIINQIQKGDHKSLELLIDKYNRYVTVIVFNILQFAPSGGRKCVFQRPLCGAERPLVFS